MGLEYCNSVGCRIACALPDGVEGRAACHRHAFFLKPLSLPLALCTRHTVGYFSVLTGAGRPSPLQPPWDSAAGNLQLQLAARPPQHRLARVHAKCKSHREKVHRVKAADEGREPDLEPSGRHGGPTIRDPGQDGSCPRCSPAPLGRTLTASCCTPPKLKPKKPSKP